MVFAETEPESIFFFHSTSWKFASGHVTVTDIVTLCVLSASSLPPKGHPGAVHLALLAHSFPFPLGTSVGSLT